MPIRQPKKKIPALPDETVPGFFIRNPQKGFLLCNYSLAFLILLRRQYRVLRLPCSAERALLSCP